jgi:hypothetical protein
MQQAAEARLRHAGIAVSNIHNAVLAFAVDCGNSGSAAHRATTAAQCLDFSEVVSSNGRASLVSTWRKCQTFTCGGAKCETTARAGVDTLTSALFTEFQGSARAALLSQSGGEADPAALQHYARQRPSSATYLAGYMTPTPRFVGSVIYSLYIATCLSVLVVWQRRRRIDRHP